MYYAHRAPACDALLEKYPHAANYIDGQLIIVGESFCDVQLDLSTLELNGEEENSITEAELDAKVDELLATGGKELVLSRAQGLYLYNKHKPEVEEVEA